MKRLAALLLVLTMTLSAALAELPWPAPATGGQAALQDYIERVNANLTALGQPRVNSLFECYPAFATLGVTASDLSDVPEDVEMTFSLDAQGVTQLQLRVCDSGRFPALAAACIQACSPSAITLEEAMAAPTRYVQRSLDNPHAAFEDAVNTQPGATPRVYYAYYPNQYSDERNWLQLTLIFPLPGSPEVPVSLTPEPGQPAAEDEDAFYGADTRTYTEEYSHLQIFTSPTPEPDSAAMDP